MTLQLYNGVVATTPIALTDRIKVSVPDLSTEPRFTYGPLAFDPIVSGQGGTRLPQAGDTAVVGVDDETGDSWVVRWHRDDTALPPYLEGGGTTRVMNNNWRWTTTVSASARQMRLDTDAWNTATEVWLSDTQIDGNDMTLILAQLLVGDEVFIQQADDSTRWAQYRINATPTDQGSWWKLPVTLIDGGTGAIPTNNIDTRVIVERVSGGGGGDTGADKNYVHTQGSPTSIWNVVHGLNKYPSVSVVDTGGSVVDPDIHYIDANNVQLTFGSPTSGKAYVN